MRTSAHQVLAELCQTVPAAVTCERDLSSENGIEASNTFATRFHRRRVQPFSSESFSDSGFDLIYNNFIEHEVCSNFFKKRFFNYDTSAHDGFSKISPHGEYLCCDITKVILQKKNLLFEMSVKLLNRTTKKVMKSFFPFAGGVFKETEQPHIMSLEISMYLRKNLVQSSCKGSNSSLFISARNLRNYTLNSCLPFKLPDLFNPLRAHSTT